MWQGCYILWLVDCLPLSRPLPRARERGVTEGACGAEGGIPGGGWRVTASSPALLHRDGEGRRTWERRHRSPVRWCRVPTCGCAVRTPHVPYHRRHLYITRERRERYGCRRSQVICRVCSGRPHSVRITPPCFGDALRILLPSASQGKCVVALTSDLAPSRGVSYPHFLRS
jgi:hypothetical protein